MNTQNKPWNWKAVGENDPLYVYNKVTSTGRVGGKVVFSVVSDDQKRTVTVENTHIPQNLSNQALASSIVRSMEFRSLVARGALEPIDPAIAEPIMSRPDVRAEQERLHLAANARRPSFSNSGAGAVPMNSQVPGRNPAGSFDAGSVINNAAPNVEMSSNRPAMHNATPMVNSGQRANIGLEIIDRYNKNEVDLLTAVATLKGVSSLLKEDEIKQLKLLQNLPPEIRQVVAAL